MINPDHIIVALEPVEPYKGYKTLHQEVYCLKDNIDSINTNIKIVGDNYNGSSLKPASVWKIKFKK